jgi:hypothetical protein
MKIRAEINEKKIQKNQWNKKADSLRK